MNQSNQTRKIINITQKLVKIRSTSNNTKENLQILSQISGLIGGTIIHHPQSNHPLLLWQPRNAHFLWLGHSDVVAGTSNQFTPKIKNNTLFGRGSFDMKGSLASFASVLQQNPQLKNIVGFLITSDEEIGGNHGAGWLINTNKINLKLIKGVIVGEPTNLAISCESKSILVIKIILVGKSAHASEPWRGINAAHISANLIKFLIDKFRQPCNENDWKSSFNVGFLNSGNHQTNIIPDLCELRIDFRLVKKDKPQLIINLITQFLNNLKNKQKIINFGLEVRTNDMSEMISRNNVLVNRILSAGKKINVKITLARSSSVSDGRFFRKKDSSIPVVRFGPSGNGAHGSNEWANINSLIVYSSVIKKIFYDQS